MMVITVMMIVDVDVLLLTIVMVVVLMTMKMTTMTTMVMMMTTAFQDLSIELARESPHQKPFGGLEDVYITGLLPLGLMQTPTYIDMKDDFVTRASIERSMPQLLRGDFLIAHMPDSNTMRRDVWTALSTLPYNRTRH